LQAPDKVNLGEEVMITAVLKDSKGAPIAGAKIRLWTPGQFLSVGGEMELGTVTTNAQGIAAFRFQARSEDLARLNADFFGDSRHSPAQAAIDVAVVGSDQLYQQTAGVRLPGIGVWLIVGALGVAWSIYIGMMALVTLIARAGTSVPGKTGETHV
ncbi:MAG: Ig-like domain-containing protein, partial [Chloroflexi bacterium]|nr:Ig-like domain-containing protein [Chloroflexota bacterium]